MCRWRGQDLYVRANKVVAESLFHAHSVLRFDTLHDKIERVHAAVLFMASVTFSTRARRTRTTNLYNAIRIYIAAEWQKQAKLL